MYVHIVRSYADSGMRPRCVTTDAHIAEIVAAHIGESACRETVLAEEAVRALAGATGVDVVGGRELTALREAVSEIDQRVATLRGYAERVEYGIEDLREICDRKAVR